MNSGKISRFQFVLITALATSVGWGVRGQLGHWTGAMIPGALLALAVAGTLALSQRILPWILLGSLLWCAAYYSYRSAYQMGVTMTFFGTAANLVVFWSMEQKLGHALPLWTLAAWKVTGWEAEPGSEGARHAFLFLLWAIILLSYGISFIQAAVLRPPAGAIAAAGGLGSYLLHLWQYVLIVEISFTMATVGITWMVFRISKGQS